MDGEKKREKQINTSFSEIKKISHRRSIKKGKTD